jgi:hypothetical protein
MTTHPWYSRRMHRLLQQYGINSSYEEISDKQHWWWDTMTANDGGVLNDQTMRDFFSSCHRMIDQNENLSSGCSDFTLSVINPATHSGLCGLRIIQQEIMLSLSTIYVQMNQMTTRNVRTILIHPNSSLFDQPDILVNGETILLSQPRDTSIVICIPPEAGSKPHLCEISLNIEEKSLMNYGPIRQIYARPLVIVYGTPSMQSLRSAMRDYAVYLASSIYTAHHSTVEVMSDMEYRAMITRKDSSSSSVIFSNVMMIGGPSINKAMSKHCADHGIVVDGISCRSSVRFYEVSENQDEEIFAIGSTNFSSSSSQLIYSFPISKQAEIAMGVCIHASSVSGWLHLSRLVWPVIPPMVRAPFANYIPDYLVFDHRIWSHGFGSVLAAGYWDSQWRFDAAQAYMK